MPTLRRGGLLKSPEAVAALRATRRLRCNPASGA